MDKIIYGVVFALAVGVFCRWVNIPAPAPPNLIGALMVFSVSAGYFATDYWIARDAKLHSQRPNTTRHLSGGHSGEPAGEPNRTVESHRVAPGGAPTPEGPGGTS